MSNITKIGFGTDIPMNIGVEDGMITMQKLSGNVREKIDSAVSYAESQELTDSQKQTARNNISAVRADEVVRYDAAQSLTDAQKAQARENISAASQYTMASLISEVNALKNSLSVMGRLRVRELTTDSIPNVCGVPMVLYGPGIPSASTVPSNWDTETMGEWTGAPMFIGQQYVNTSASSGGLYYAVNTTDVNGWKNANA